MTNINIQHQLMIKSNPLEVMDTPEVVSPSGVEGQKAKCICDKEQKREKRRNEGLNKTRTGNTGKFFHWLADSKLVKEIAEVNALYRSFSSYGKVQKLNKMTKTINSKEYYAAKGAAKKNLSNWQKAQ